MWHHSSSFAWGGRGRENASLLFERYHTHTSVVPKQKPPFVYWDKFGTQEEQKKMDNKDSGNIFKSLSSFFLPCSIIIQFYFGALRIYDFLFCMKTKLLSHLPLLLPQSWSIYLLSRGRGKEKMCVFVSLLLPFQIFLNFFLFQIFSLSFSCPFILSVVHESL